MRDYPTADPWATRNEDGTITLHWPDDEPDVALISRELLTSMIEDHNRMTRRPIAFIWTDPAGKRRHTLDPADVEIAYLS